MSQLIATVRDGTVSQGGNMPAWMNVLTDDEIVSILLWLQSRWPPDIYAQWRMMDQASRTQ